MTTLILYDWCMEPGRLNNARLCFALFFHQILTSRILFLKEKNTIYTDHLSFFVHVLLKAFNICISECYCQSTVKKISNYLIFHIAFPQNWNSLLSGYKAKVPFYIEKYTSWNFIISLWLISALLAIGVCKKKERDPALFCYISNIKL